MEQEFVVTGPTGSIRFGGSCGDPLPVLLTADVPPYDFTITMLRDGKFELDFGDSENECGDSFTFDDIEDAKRAALELIGAAAISWVSRPPAVG